LFSLDQTLSSFVSKDTVFWEVTYKNIFVTCFWF
jgi:hypothetical protein